MSSEEISTSKNVLVVYYSLSGNTARVARDIASRTSADLESIQDRLHGVGFMGYLRAALDAVRKVPAKIGDSRRHPSHYALTIIGTPIWVGNMTPAVRAYILRWQGQFKNVAFFVTSGNTDVLRVLPALEGLAKREPIAVAGFNAQELKDAGIYDRKVSDFISAMGLAPRTPSVEAGEPARA